MIGVRVYKLRRNEGPDAILLGGILVMILAFLDSSCAWIAGIMFILLGIKSMMNNPVFSKKCLVGIILAVVGSVLGLLLE